MPQRIASIASYRFKRGENIYLNFQMVIDIKSIIHISIQRVERLFYDTSMYHDVNETLGWRHLKKGGVQGIYLFILFGYLDGNVNYMLLSTGLIDRNSFEFFNHPRTICRSNPGFFKGANGADIQPTGISPPAAGANRMSLTLRRRRKRTFFKGQTWIHRRYCLPTHIAVFPA